MAFPYTVARKILLWIDQKLGTKLKPTIGHFYRRFLRVWSLVRRVVDPLVIKTEYKMGLKRPKNLRLHLGCGSKHFDGYVNVDLWISEATDVICDITRLPWPDNSAVAVESYHVVEHISHQKISQTLKEWYRVLQPDGTLIVECPHFDEAIKEYLEGNEERLLNIFGRQRFSGDTHLYGYNPKRLIRYLQEAGFSDFIEGNPQSSQTLDEPSFRIECKK